MVSELSSVISTSVTTRSSQGFIKKESHCNDSPWPSQAG